MSLRFRIAESLPKDSVSLRALLQIARIEESTQVPTACVTFGSEPRLLVNPQFVQEHAPTPAKLQALIGHELLHVALGHTRRYAQSNAMDNLVFDCLINAIWSKAHPTPEATALFRDFYREDSFPQCFLRPPDDWYPTERIKLPAVLKQAEFEGIVFVKDVYKQLWGYSGASAWEIREAIRIGMRGMGLAVDTVIARVPLLGGHDAAHAQGVGDAATLRGFVGDLAEEYATKLNGMPIDGECLAREVLAPLRLTPERVSVRRQLRHLFAYLAHGQGPARISGGEEIAVTLLTPVPTRDRRAIVQRQLGVTPLLYQGESVRRRPSTSERVHVYLDVSGSMSKVIRPLYGAMIDCKDWVAPQVHLFSTTVDDIPMKELERGLLETTGGTSVECIARHIEANRIRRALILTDGHVGCMSAETARTLSKTRLAVAWAGESTNEHDLGRFAGRSMQLALAA